MKFYHSIFAVALVLTTGYANQPSFDCAKVKKDSSEEVICSSDQLMDLDRELARVYKKTLTKTPKDKILKVEQRGWIKGRNTCWKVKDEKKCMVSEYNNRIDELIKKYTLSSKKGLKMRILLRDLTKS